jgi:hypothetical protein
MLPGYPTGRRLMCPGTRDENHHIDILSGYLAGDHRLCPTIARMNHVNILLAGRRLLCPDFPAAGYRRRMCPGTRDTSHLSNIQPGNPAGDRRMCLGMQVGENHLDILSGYLAGDRLLCPDTRARMNHISILPGYLAEDHLLCLDYSAGYRRRLIPGAPDEIHLNVLLYNPAGDRRMCLGMQVGEIHLDFLSGYLAGGHRLCLGARACMNHANILPRDLCDWLKVWLQFCGQQSMLCDLHGKLQFSPFYRSSATAGSSMFRAMDCATTNPLANEPMASCLDLGEALQDSKAPHAGQLTLRHSLFDLRKDVGTVSTQKAVCFSQGQESRVGLHVGMDCSRQDHTVRLRWSLVSRWCPAVFYHCCVPQARLAVIAAAGAQACDNYRHRQ